MANYLAYVDGKYLDGGSVYRLVSLNNQTPETQHRIEVVYWGMKTPDDNPVPFAPIRHETTLETGLKHLDGTVSIVRNAPGSATPEFSICIGPQPELDIGGGWNPDGQGFAAFGQVISGRDVIRKIHQLAQAAQFLRKPISVMTVRRVYLIQSGLAKKTAHMTEEQGNLAPAAGAEQASNSAVSQRDAGFCEK